MRMHCVKTVGDSAELVLVRSKVKREGSCLGSYFHSPNVGDSRWT